MSPTEMRARADECERLADSLEPTPGDLREMLHEVAAQWRRLADDAEAHPNPPIPLPSITARRRRDQTGDTAIAFPRGRRRIVRPRRTVRSNGPSYQGNGIGRVCWFAPHHFSR